MKNGVLSFVGLFAALALATGGCGDDGEMATPDGGGMDDGGGTPDAGTPETGTADTGTADTGTADTGMPDTGAEDAATEDAATGDAATADAGDAGGDTAPMITEIAWMPDGACEAMDRSDMVVTVTVVDPDTPAGELTFSGVVAGCTGMIDAAVSTLSCPQLNPYTGSVTVSDGVDEDTESFTMPVCDTSSTTF